MTPSRTQTKTRPGFASHTPTDENITINQFCNDTRSSRQHAAAAATERTRCLCERPQVSSHSALIEKAARQSDECPVGSDVKRRRRRLQGTRLMETRLMEELSDSDVSLSVARVCKCPQICILFTNSLITRLLI